MGGGGGGGGGGEWEIQLIGALYNHQDRIELPIPHYGESISTYHISNAAEQHKDGHFPNHQWSIHSTLCNERNKYLQSDNHYGRNYLLLQISNGL